MENKNQESVDQLRPHVYDGIEEYDNPLPRWWVGGFYLCIAFSVIYMGYYHIAGGPSTLDEMNTTLAAHKEEAAQASGSSSGGGDLTAMLADQNAIAAGKEIYQQNCTPCHGQVGEGVVGPNLVDKYWLHGGKPEEILKTISEGVVEKGMIAWTPLLGMEKVKQVTAFVHSIGGTNPPNAKAPEGQPME